MSERDWKSGVVRSARCALSLWLALALGCMNGAHHEAEEPSDDHLSYAEEVVADMVEAGIEAQVPPALPEEQVALHVYVLKVRKRAAEVKAEAQAATAPIVILLSIFAVDGPAELVLTLVPAHKVAKVRDVIKRGRALKATKKNIAALERLMGELGDELDDATRQVLFISNNLDRSRMRALIKIGRATRSPDVIRTLIRRELDHTADVRWIGRMMRERKLDPEFVHRFTFDASLVEDVTLHEANPSWRALQRVIQGKSVDKDARSALANKITGLLGERAAAKMLKQRRLVAKYFKDAKGPKKLSSMWRGATYGNKGSIDIVAFGPDGKMLMVEVKNWASGWWELAFKRQEVLKQLVRHNGGIDEIKRRALNADVADKVLMVSKDGFMRGMKPKDRREFRNAAKQHGWSIELMPSNQIGDFRTFIDDLRSQ